MKKLIMVTVIFTILMNTSAAFSKTSATNLNKIEFPKGSKENQQIFGYYMMDFYMKDILKAMQNHYKDVRVDGYQVPWWKKHDTVSITQPWVKDLISNSEKRIRFSYALKITLIPIDENGRILGIDTLYFEVEPGRFHMKGVRDLPPVQLMKYEHKDPPKQKEPHV
jgi:hypothetical protein